VKDDDEYDSAERGQRGLGTGKAPGKGLEELGTEHPGIGVRSGDVNSDSGSGVNGDGAGGDIENRDGMDNPRDRDRDWDKNRYEGDRYPMIFRGKSLSTSLSQKDGNSRSRFDFIDVVDGSVVDGGGGGDLVPAAESDGQLLVNDESEAATATDEAYRLSANSNSKYGYVGEEEESDHEGDAMAMATSERRTSASTFTSKPLVVTTAEPRGRGRGRGTDGPTNRPSISSLASRMAPRTIKTHSGDDADDVDGDSVNDDGEGEGEGEGEGGARRPSILTVPLNASIRVLVPVQVPVPVQAPVPAPLIDPRRDIQAVRKQQPPRQPPSPHSIKKPFLLVDGT
jgi:hypothetical protein